MKRRNTAFLIVLCMIVSMLPVFTVSADNSGFYKLIAEDTMTPSAYNAANDTKLNALEDKEFGEGWSFPWSTSKTQYEMTNTNAKLDTNGMFIGRPSSSKNQRLYRSFYEPIDFSKDGTYTFTVKIKDSTVETQDFVCEVGDTGFAFGVYQSDGTHYRPQLKVPGATNVIFSGTTGTPTGKTVIIEGEVVTNSKGSDTFRVKAYTNAADKPEWFIEKTAEMGEQTASFIGVGYNYISEGAKPTGVSRVNSIVIEYDNPELMEKIEYACTSDAVTAEEIKDAFSYLIDYTGSDKEELIESLKLNATNVGLESAIYAEITSVEPDFTDGKAFAHEFEDTFDITYSYPLNNNGIFYIKDLENNIIAQSSSIEGKKVSMVKVSDFSIGTSYILSAEGVTDFKGDTINNVSFSTVVVPTVNIAEGERYNGSVTITWDETTMDSISANLVYPSGQTVNNIQNNLTVTEAGDYELSINATKGLLSDITIINFTVLPDIKPEARNVKIAVKDIAALYETGSVLVGTYEFYDENSCDSFKEAILKWYRTDGISKKFVGEGEEYTLTEDDENHDIIFEVTPISDSAANPVGDPTESEPFTGAYAPVGSDITVDTSSILVGSTLTADFEFSDKNGDDEGEHIVRWYQFIDTDYVEITENVSSLGILEVTEDLIGRYVYVEITPVSTNKPYYGKTITSGELEIKLAEGAELGNNEDSDFPSFEVSYLYDNISDYKLAGTSNILLATYAYPYGITGSGFSTNWSTQKRKYAAPTGSSTFFQVITGSYWGISWRGPDSLYRAVKDPFSMAENGTYTFITDVFEYGGTSSSANLDESDFRMYIGGTDWYYGYTDDGESSGFIPQIKAQGNETVAYGEVVAYPTGVSNRIMRIKAEVEVTDGEDIFKVKMWRRAAAEPDGWSVVTTGEIGDYLVEYVGFTPNPGEANGLRYLYFSADYENIGLKNQINSLVANGTATEEELTKAFQDMSKYPEGDEKDAIISALKTMAGDTGASVAKITETPSEPVVANEVKTIKFKYNLALSEGSFVLKDKENNVVSTTTSINENYVTLFLTDTLENGEEYTIDASGVVDYKGDSVPGFSFTTYATPEINVSDNGIYSEKYQINWDASQATDITVSLLTPKGVQTEIENGYALLEIGEYKLTISGTKNDVTDTRTITFIVDEDIAPIVSKVSIRGFHETGATLTGSYVYSDANNDTEADSELKWYRVKGTNKTLIGTGISYVLKTADENANIVFSVTPKANSIVNPIGEETFSNEFEGAYAPVIEKLVIKGEVSNGEEIYASYQYYDENNDAEANSVIKWYLEDGTEITENISNGKLTITEEVFEKKVYVAVTPMTLKKPVTGKTVVSEKLLMPSKPTVSDVTITGTAAIGNMLTASYKFSDPNLDVEGASRYEWKNASTGKVLGTNRTLEITQSMAGIGITVTIIGVSENIPTDSEAVTSEVYRIPSTLSTDDDDDDYKYSGSNSGSKGGGGGSSVISGGTVKPAEKPIFTDIATHWAKEYVYALLDKGIVSKDEAFRPDDSISRAEVLAMLFRSSGKPLSKYVGLYGDVKEGDWYADYVQTALDAGIISPAEIFRPNDSITREEAAKIIANMLNLVAETEADFSDKDLVSDWATDYVNAVYEAGIFKGDDNGNFNPRGALKRAETATVIYRLLDSGAFTDGGVK